MQSTLVLNASYEPLSIVPAKRAVVLMLQDKATALDLSEATFRSEKNTIQLPYVVLLKKYHKVGRSRPAPWTRHGVLVRDGWRCAYCGEHATTIDHVLPQSRGGKNTYENTVACCLRCNNRKGDQKLETLGWHLSFTPAAPSVFALMIGRARRSNNSEQMATWANYFPDGERRFLQTV
jgi:5-methylcytosine-specific restriction endonuclease McrA